MTRASKTASPTTGSRHINSRKSPAERHQELLDAAVAIGATDGLGAVTLARVAAKVGVSSGLVHHYFSSAQEMIDATFRHAADTDLDAARTRVATAATPTEQIAELLDYLFDETSAAAAALWVDAASMGRRHPTLAAEADTVNDAWLAFLADIVTAGTHTGEFTVTHPEVTARRLLTIIDGLGAQTTLPTPTDHDDDDDGAEGSTDYVRAHTAPHGLDATELKGIATDFARHELGLTH